MEIKITLIFHDDLVFPPSLACDGFLVSHGHVIFTEATAEVTCNEKYSYSVGSTHNCRSNGRLFFNSNFILLEQNILFLRCFVENLYHS